MKKFILFAASIAAVVMFVSCNKGGNNSGNAETILPAPATAVNARKMVMESSAIATTSVHYIELTESARYIVAEEKNGHITYQRGKYVLLTKAAQHFSLEGYGTITIDGNNITIAPKTGETVTVPFTQATTLPASDFFTTVARAWKVEKTDLAVNMDGKSIGVVKSGCDLPAIATELNSKGLSINVDALQGYVVKELNFTMAKTIEIAFTGKDSFVGSFNMSASGKFDYKFEGSVGNQMLSAEANGNVDNTQESGKLYVTFNTKVSSAGKEYTGTVMFILSPATD